MDMVQSFATNGLNDLVPYAAESLALHVHDGRGGNNSGHLRTGKALNLSTLALFNLWMGFEVIVQCIRKGLGELLRAVLPAQYPKSDGLATPTRLDTLQILRNTENHCTGGSMAHVSGTVYGKAYSM